MVSVKNLQFDGTQLADLPIPLGKYKFASKGYMEENGTWFIAMESNIYCDVYEA